MLAEPGRKDGGATARRNRAAAGGHAGAVVEGQPGEQNPPGRLPEERGTGCTKGGSRREEPARATKEAASLATAAQSMQTGGAHSSRGSGDPPLVSKWAADSFSGKEEDWKVWSLKFRSYVGAMAKGSVGTWMD